MTRLDSTWFGLILAVAACSADSKSPPPGHEGGPCHAGTCLEGLECLEDLCVERPGTTEATGATGETWPGADVDGSDTDGQIDDAGTDTANDTANTAGTHDGGDGGGPETSGSASGAGTDGDGGSQQCDPPPCASYEAKMKSCFPMWDYDSYEECVYIFEVCNGSGGACANPTPTVVNCRLSASCDDLLDCNQGTQC